MNTDKKIRLGIATVSAVLHAALLFFVIFTTQAKTVEIEEATLVSLVNISEYKEEAPAPKIVVKPPPVKEKPPELIPVQEEIAEILIETEEEPVVSEIAERFIETDEKPVVSGGGDAVNKAAVSRYLQSNYNYIQRRIMNELIYPSQARRTGVQGVVEVSFVINMDGSISDTAVRKSSGNKLLDDEALRAVKSASPFRKPVTQVKIAIPVSFKLT
ncbi:MAG: energy transducer TonB [Spirochaetaceae bacterium]|jgi:protein TonB|nr:energy transducer TonB [Spirochaetaceae bacterium]